MRLRTLFMFALLFLGIVACESVSAFQCTTGSVTPYYSSTSFWNTPIPYGAAIDSNSSTIVANAITPYVGSANVANTNAWGTSKAQAASSSPTYSVICTLYCTQSNFLYQIPLGAVPSTGSDHHLTVISANGTQELDMWQAVHNSTNNTWSASSIFVNNVTGWGATCSPGQHCNGAVASGFALMGGMIRPEEVLQGHIDHALALQTPITRSGYIACPATHTDGKYNTTAAIPEGARIQLDPTFNVAAQSWPAWEKAIAIALQNYGAYVADTGGSLAVAGQTDMNAGNTTWSAAAMPKGASLSNLPWSRVHVLQIQSCN